MEIEVEVKVEAETGIEGEESHKGRMRRRM